MRAQIAVVGAGPAGLLLSHLLAAAGIRTVVVEHRSEAHVRGRVRAGLLEQRTVRRLREAGLGSRLDREGMVHDGFHLRFDGESHHLSTTSLAGAPTVVYGQQEIVKDLLAARTADHGTLHFDASEVTVAAGENPAVGFAVAGKRIEVHADFIAGCDGFHGPSRESAPPGAISCYRKEFPFAWLGVLAETAPVSRELIYSMHERGFALLSMRTPELSRLYLQVAADEDLREWPGDRVFAELRARFCAQPGERLADGAVRERVLVPLRSFTCEPMQHGRLFLAGDSAHVFPPSAAKGLNVALADAAELAEAFRRWYAAGDRTGLDGYSPARMREVWRIQDFSEWVTWLWHTPADRDGPADRLRMARLRHLATSERAAAAFAEQYAGL